MPDFNGSDYDSKRDKGRLTNQLKDIKGLMLDGDWRTLSQIADQTGHPQPSISAQLRHLRKPRFGSFLVEKEYLGSGLYQYRVLPGENENV